MEIVVTTKRQKNYNISLLRFMAMLFIVLCHFFQYYDVELAWWFNVGVQMFFCISGFLYANKRIESAIDFISKNLRKILIPYFCFLVPIIVIYFFFARDSITIDSVASALLTNGVINGIEHLWFIPYILFCYLITPYLQILAEKMRKTRWYVFCLIFCILIICGEIFSYAFNSYFVFNRIFCYLFGYFAAVFLQEYGRKIYKLLVCVLTVTTILLNCLRIYCKYIGNFSFKGFAIFEGYAHALLGISIVLFSLLFIKIEKKIMVFELSDKYSFYVYLVHQLFILSPFTLLTVTPHKILNWFLTIIAILVSAILLEFVSRIATNYFTITINRLKEKVVIK
jgi:peptidoglycan/LPS O-acetylase OafA/YrhL